MTRSRTAITYPSPSKCPTDTPAPTLPLASIPRFSTTSLVCARLYKAPGQSARGGTFDARRKRGSKRSTLDIEGKIAEWRGRGGGGGDGAPSAPPLSTPPAATQLVLGGGGEGVVCALLPPPAALIDDLKTRLDAKDEDNESGIHESE
ncbi:hypothetical protein MSG28_004393 [Choristoneura fumiferana]|uniref:Uncharacterized protein n=1 Tax=Choristoneura fumiferana TaxID=7141 RepID=A0ACC0KJ29_CHOFU|nr:hypothetical protein MSG28_004393 [Choristoneura fumiferana]